MASGELSKSRARESSTSCALTSVEEIAAVKSSFFRSAGGRNGGLDVVREMGALLRWHRSENIFAAVGMDVCAGGHGVDVMKAVVDEYGDWVEMEPECIGAW
jgi:hypothetical protein